MLIHVQNVKHAEVKRRKRTSRRESIAKLSARIIIVTTSQIYSKSKQFETDTWCLREHSLAPISIVIRRFVAQLEMYFNHIRMYRFIEQIVGFFILVQIMNKSN